MIEDTQQKRIRVREQARAVAQELRPLLESGDRGESYSADAVRLLQDAGFTALRVPAAYGGADVDITSLCIVQEELARVDLGLSNFISDQTVPSELLRHHGTEAQQEEFFARIVEGHELWCLAVTEPGAGSDLGSISTTAHRDGDVFVINGTKCWASTGGRANIYVVLASTAPDLRVKGLSALVVERDAEGFEVGREHPKMGWRTTSTTELSFNDVRVDSDRLIGAENEGFGLFETALTVGRLGIGAQALGMAEAAFECARDYARERQQFGRRIADFQAIRFMLADMATDIELGRLLTYRATEAADQEDPSTGRLTAMTKYWLSDMAMRLTTDAVQILGAVGFSSDYPVERMMRDAKGLQIADGTNQIMRVLVGREVVGE